MVPETDEDWPKCVTGEQFFLPTIILIGIGNNLGPICEPPPPVPFEGKVTVNVTEKEVDTMKTCKVTAAPI